MCKELKELAVAIALTKQISEAGNRLAVLKYSMYPLRALYVICSICLQHCNKFQLLKSVAPENPKSSSKQLGRKSRKAFLQCMSCKWSNWELCKPEKHISNMGCPANATITWHLKRFAFRYSTWGQPWGAEGTEKIISKARLAPKPDQLSRK